MNFFKKLFGVGTSDTTVLETPKVEKTDEVFNPNQEFRDLGEKHGDFFTDKSSAIQLMQPQIGATSANIADVNLSRSDAFFSNAPGFVLTKETDQILELKKYMGVPTEAEELENFIFSSDEEAIISMQSRINS